MHQKCLVWPFLQIHVLADYSKTPFELIKDKEEVGATLWDAVCQKIG